MFGTPAFHPCAAKSLISDPVNIQEYLKFRTSELPLDVRIRAANYIRFKETKSTFEIEGEGDKTTSSHPHLIAILS